MADASFIQTNFQGGEWSPFTQGRMDKPEYRSAMNVSLNGHATEEGGWTRRPGFRFRALTRGGATAALREFHFDQQQPYIMEFTPNHLRLFKEDASLLTNGVRLDVSLDVTTNPMSVSTGTAAHGLGSGDEVQFFQNLPGANPGQGHLLGRQFFVTVVDDFTFTVPFDGALITAIPSGGNSFSKIQDFATAYLAAELPDVRTIQDNVDLVVLHAKHPPFDLLATTQADPANCVEAAFNWNAVVFKDGPYLDPVTTTQTISFAADIPTGSQAFVITSVDPTTDVTLKATDVGRLMRVLGEPLPFVLGDDYVYAQTVQYQGNDYTVSAAAGVTAASITPDLDTDNWNINVYGSAWVWGIITAVATPYTGTLEIADGATLLYGNSQALPTWRLGLYSDTTGWPSVGVYHEGRFVLANQFIPNRLDFSMSNDPFTFSPTGPDGTVADNNGIAAVFQSTEVNPILWVVADDQGIVAGTQGKEWLVRSSAVGDPITPTSIQVRPVSAYGTSDVEAKRVGTATLFVSRFNRKIYEFMGDVYAGSGKYSAINLALNSKHITAPGVSELAYQREIVPKLWVRLGDNTLAGITYKRDGSFSPNQQTGSFSGWHRNILGSNRLVESITSGPTHYGLDTLWIVSVDPTTGVRWVEQLTDIFGQNADPTTAFFVDGGRVPTASQLNGTTSITYFGYDDLEGETLSVWAAGLDVGDFVVTNGTITVPFDSTFTLALLASQTPSFTGGDLYSLGVTAVVAAPSGTPSTVNTSELLWFDHPNTGVVNVDGGVPDWNFNVLRAAKGGHGTSAGFRLFDLTTGVQLVEANTTSLFGDDDSRNASISGAVDSKGNIYGVSAATNCCEVFKVNATLTAASFWGTAGISFGSDADHLAASRMMRSMTMGARDFIWSSALNGNIIGSGELAVFDGDNMAWITNLNATEPRTVITHSMSLLDQCMNGAVMYAFGTAMDTGASVTLYRIAGQLSMTGEPSFSLTPIRTYAPADIDPTWTVLGGGGAVLGVEIDQMDGNVIFSIMGSDGVTDHGGYLVKVNPADGSIIWQIIGLGGIDPSASRIANASLVQMAGGKIYQINTLLGTATSVTQPVIFSAGATIWDGIEARLIGYGSFTQDVGSPTLEGTTPTSFTNEFFQFGLGTPGIVAGTIVTAPAVIGYTYTSQGQILRPIAPQDTGAQNGPALAKTRRAHQYAALIHRTGPIKFGTTFAKLRPAEFKTAGGIPYAKGVLYNGTIWTTIEDDYSFDSMIGWQIDRPNPATVLTIGSFLHTQDR